MGTRASRGSTGLRDMGSKADEWSRKLYDGNWSDIKFLWVFIFLAFTALFQQSIYA
jgi:hypothetical protein